MLPKPLQKRPVIIYAHGWHGTLINDGDDLREMAEMGLAVVDIDYDQTNEAAFDFEFQAVRNFVLNQSWADTNATAWVGGSMGANHILQYAFSHPDQQPRLAVLFSGAGTPLPTVAGREKTAFLLIHGDEDDFFPVGQTEELASFLRTNAVPVELRILRGLPHSLKPERAIVFRAIGEYCRTHLVGKLEGYRSMAQWEAHGLGLGWYWLPAGAWAAIGYACRQRRKTSVLGKFAYQRHEIALRCLATILAVWAAAETALHVITPMLPVNDATLAISRRILVGQKNLASFEFLTKQSIWRGQKLKVLLDQAQLADYNRGLVDWRVSDPVYRDYVLTPEATFSNAGASAPSGPDSRRALWEEFYPRIRHESSPAEVAKIVVRHLRERITIAACDDLPHEVPDIWLEQITDEKGFHAIYVAALRAIGLPARLNTDGDAEFYDGNEWQSAPLPAIISW